MTIADMNEAVRGVIRGLMGAKENDFCSDELAKLNFNAAKYTAVVIIVANRREQEVTDYAIEKCLEIYQANKSEMFHLRSSEALSAAATLATYEASRGVVEKIVALLAENGWCGKLKDLTRKLLNRAITSAEVMALVDHYVNNKGSRAQHREEELLRLAQIYAPEIKSEVGRKIALFAIEFESHCD
jgi:hypothetical protein